MNYHINAFPNLKHVDCEVVKKVDIFNLFGHNQPFPGLDLMYFRSAKYCVQWSHWWAKYQVVFELFKLSQCNIPFTTFMTLK